MKKMVLTMTAALLMGTSMMAQDAERRGGQMGREQMNSAEMVKQRTDETVKRYNLNEEQAKLLLQLNTEYADSMRPSMGPRQGGQRPPQMRERRAPQGGDSLQGRRGRPNMPQGGMQGGGFERMQKMMEGYNAKLKTIMTEEQFKAYQEDQQNRRGQFRGGQRPPTQRQQQ